MKKRLLALVLALCMLTGVTACSSGQQSSSTATGSTSSTESTGGEESKDSSSEKITLSLYRSGATELIHEILDPVVEEYQKQNPNVTVELTPIGFGEVAQKLAVMSSSKTMPDVMYLLMMEAMQYADFIVPLNDYIDNSPLKDDYYPNILEQAYYNDNLIELPSNGSTIMLWYNKELFEQAGLDPDSPPQTTDEMLEYAKTITEKTDAAGFGLHAKGGGDDIVHQMYVFYQLFSGADVWDIEKGQYTFIGDDKNMQALKDSYQWLYDLDAKEKVTQGNIVEYGRFDLRAMLRDGAVGMVFDGVWIDGTLREGLEAGKFMSAVLPKGPSGNNKSIFDFGGWAMGANTKDKDETWKFMEFLMSTESQIKHSDYGSSPLLNSEFKENEKYQIPYWNVVNDSVMDATTEPISENRASFHQTIYEYSQQILTGAMSADEGVNQMVEQLKADAE